jgi:hypothetical protein
MLDHAAFENISLTKVAVLIHQVKLAAEKSLDDILVRILVRVTCYLFILLNK